MFPFALFMQNCKLDCNNHNIFCLGHSAVCSSERHCCQDLPKLDDILLWLTSCFLIFHCCFYRRFNEFFKYFFHNAVSLSQVCL
ncbi:hypothetical protein GDO81_007459 [Engystomops pustulosus]|uniref:Uncharacterized protein n=1 Tax=Engystomops pustulosus TaxID=76066 RepID=A0AAV7C7D9_ENGPU|nr:hypothetical protein GDO81_007459 [Engystomops pustulosus]